MVKIPNLGQHAAIFPKLTGTGPIPQRVRKIPALLTILEFNEYWTKTPRWNLIRVCDLGRFLSCQQSLFHGTCEMRIMLGLSSSALYTLSSGTP